MQIQEVLEQMKAEPGYEYECGRGLMPGLRSTYGFQWDTKKKVVWFNSHSHDWSGSMTEQEFIEEFGESPWCIDDKIQLA